MRFYDEVASGVLQLESGWGIALNDTHVVAADDVFDDQYRHLRSPVQPIPDYVCVRSPFTKLWIEGWWDKRRRTRIGWALSSFAMPEDREIFFEGFLPLIKGEKVLATSDGPEVLASCDVLQLHHLNLSLRDQAIGPHGWIVLGLDEYGYSRRLSNGEPVLIAWASEMWQRYAASVGTDAWQLLRIAAAPLWHVLGLLHCKNIALEAHDPPHALARKHMRKHGIALHRYYTLKVTSPSGQKRTGAARNGQAELPQHIVRGHFKTYTPDKPLFGALTGTYWWPAHARGDREHGTITKDYEVVLPE